MSDEVTKEEFLSFVDKLSLILTETNSLKTRFLKDETREELIDDVVTADMESFDNSCFKDVLTYGFSGYGNESDLDLVKHHIDMVWDCYDDITEMPDTTYDVKNECQAYIDSAIEKALGLKE